MFTHNIQLGKQSTRFGQKRGSYERRNIETKSKQDKYAYLESRSGEYDERERQIMDDPYADGWAWYDNGMMLSEWKVSRWLSGKSKAEQTRLFEMGFYDAEAYEKVCG